MTSTWSLFARPRLLIAAIVVVALCLRVALAVADPDFRPVADAADYDQHAVTLATSGTYPDSGLVGGPSAFRPPAYPYVLGGAYRLTGTADSEARWTVGRVVGALLSTLLVILIGALTLRFWDRGTAIVAMALAALYLPLITVGDALLADGLFAVLAVAAVLAALAARPRPSRDSTCWWLVGLAGALAGAATLTRTNGVVVVAVLALAVWGRPWRRPAALAAPVALVAAAAVVIAPWSVRNALAFDAFVPVSTQGGFTLAGTYNDVTRTDPVLPGKWRAIIVEPYASVLDRRGLDEAEADRALRAAAREYVADHPTYVLKVGLWNTIRLAGLQGADAERPVAPEIGVSGRTSDAHVYAFYVLALLAIGGMVAGAFRARPWPLWVLPAALVVSLVFVTSPNTRYRTVIDALLMPPAAVGVVAAATRLRARTR